MVALQAAGPGQHQRIHGAFRGLDVGKGEHHGHGARGTGHELTPVGQKVFDKPLPNSEPKLRVLFAALCDACFHEPRPVTA